MALKNFRRRAVALLSGLFLSVAVWAGLESGTYISDLVVTNPLGSDLTSTIDDHIRLLKSTIKTTFPNINGAVTVTDEQLNTVATNVAANPTGTIGLTAVNGSASTYIRSDGAPALSQSITPTWTGAHTFTNSNGIVVSNATTPAVSLRESGATTNNKNWYNVAFGEQLQFQAINDALNASSLWLTVDRTGTTVDTVALPTDSSSPTDSDFYVGSNEAGNLSSQLATFRTGQANITAINAVNQTATQTTQRLHNQATSGDNIFLTFLTESGLTGTTRGSIDFNRAGTLTRYNTTSDIRLKKNFKPAPSARKVIDCILIESYDWKETGAHVEHGVVAQRLNECAPYAVSKGKVWQVDKSTLIPALIKYVQEQDARIARLEADAARRH
jgi:hypothetical protein